ncbi:SpoIIIAH-like family protein [Alkalicoccobacillus murimartini]|uniref:Stage III sporulation protein AH n=1 Tax=Alkalicoccobacillus murimartini TaxID=171685 RepID=A0ABT9YN99_9BACI|nr:SpoIIIAH-like family protein [Alkalicoccobacillus murimartini]MDQ0208966.1 stage III sporulation protein AH [Alkalicoccobacillus murimartini]
MALKKQTVWLLTMLSLVIVLSVYYVTSDPTNLAVTDEDQQQVEETPDGLEVQVTPDGEVEEGSLEVTGAESTADSYAAARIKVVESRAQQAEQYVETTTSPDATPEEKVAAHDKSMAILNLTQSEETLEALVKAKGYQNVLVISEENKVQIMVEADELSIAEANDIILLAKDKLGQANNVSVSHNTGVN